MNKNIIIAKSFLLSSQKLNKKESKATFSTIEKLTRGENLSALQIHDIENCKCDKNFRSARVNKELRVIFLMQGDNYKLLYVDHHDDAYRWCDGKYSSKTDFGSEYMYDEIAFEEKANTNIMDENVFFGSLKPLLEEQGINKQEIMKLGIREIHAETILKINDEGRLLEYLDVFPEEQMEAIMDLASGEKKFEEVYNSLLDVDENDNIIDGIDQKDSKRRYYLATTDELKYLMENDEFEKWKLFLHPSQKRIVDGFYNGPVLIEGGPGTGKTIVGIHRAVQLAQNVFKKSDNKKILICTFSKKLARIIRQKVDELLNQHNMPSNIDVCGIDSYIYQLLRDNNVSLNVDMNAFYELFKRIYYSEERTEPIEFYHYEYFEIIEKNHITTETEYLEVNRKGAGKPIRKTVRKEIWNFFEKIFMAKKEFKVYTFVDRAIELLNLIDSGSANLRYDAVIIDEAQDLEAIKLKAVCRSIKNTANGNSLFILSDVNQRIFRLSTWKNDIGINVVGRTHYLKVNYRTTKQISDYARYQFKNANMINSHVKEYKSITSGNQPIIEGFENKSQQLKYILDKVKRYITVGYPMYEIGIICPSNSHCHQVETILEINNIQTNLLTGENIPAKDKGVSICTTSGVKGLEFSVVIVFEYKDIGQYKMSYFSKPEIKLDYDKLIECEKYVATTRARDELTITYIEEEEEW